MNELDWQEEFIDWLNRFGGVPCDRNATLREWLGKIAAAEREACAKVADDHWERYQRDCGGHPQPCFREIAAAIRARGEKK